MTYTKKLENIHKEFYNVENVMTLDNHPKIHGFDFSKDFDFTQFIKAFSSTGFQASHLGQAIAVTQAMQREKATIFLSFTSNMISSGCRDIIRFLVEKKKVDVLVTSGGGIEEDIMKCLKPFVMGEFEAPGKMLFDHGINRIGNIFVPNDRYTYLDKFMQKFFEDLYQKQKKRGKPFSAYEVTHELGLAIDNKESVLYWAAKNNIPVFCPGIVDGSIGDLLVFFKQKRPDFFIDVTGDVTEVTKITLNSKKTAVIALGGGTSKHFALNANVFRDGCDFAVYINTAQEYDGCDSGARTEEAITWGKIKPQAPSVKVHCDATIAFPLLVAGAFVEISEKKKRKKAT